MKDSEVSKYKALKKAFLWTDVCSIIAELIIGAVIILGGVSGFIAFRIQLTLLVLIVALSIGINNLIRIEDNRTIVKVFAWISFVSNIVWSVLVILLIWEIIPLIDVVMVSTTPTTSAGINASLFLRVVAIAVNLGSTGFWASNVMAIQETVKPVKPLKYTSLICNMYCCIFALVVTLVSHINFNELFSRWSALFLLAELAFVLTALAALIVSKTNAKEKRVGDRVDQGITQSQIQEMVEKEVRAKMSAMQNGGEVGVKQPNAEDGAFQKPVETSLQEKTEPSLQAMADAPTHGVGVVPSQNISNESIHNTNGTPQPGQTLGPQ